MTEASSETMPVTQEGMREQIARIIDPFAWTERASYLDRARHWEERAVNDTQRFLARSNRHSADKQVEPSLAKADAILRLTQSAPDAAPEGPMSRCKQCGARYPSAPLGVIHKCGWCSGGMCEREDTTSPETPGAEALEPARPIVEAIAAWERENGTVAAIMPHEYADLCERIKRAAVKGSCRAALSKPDMRKAQG